MVVRNQLIESDSDELSVVTQEGKSTTQMMPETNKQKAATIWNFDDSGTASSNNNNDDDDDLLALLATRDLSISSKPVKGKNKKGGQHVEKPAAAATAPKPQQPSHLVLQETFPLVTLAEHDEEWDEDYFTMSLGVDVHQEHIDRLLTTYLRDEDDAENLNALRHAGLGNAVREGSYASSGMPTTPFSDPSASIQPEAEEDNEDEKDIKTANETEEYFQQRVQISPNQVLRYAYGGLPLWITSPSPLEGEKGKALSVPACELCGSPRTFECQLMPALLSHLVASRKKGKDIQVSEAETTIADQSDLRGRLRSMLGSGLDFGVVTLWSCPLSCCPPTGSFATEVAVVQPPPDTLSLDL